MDENLNTLALGMDLSTLGFDLNSNGPLYVTMASCFAPDAGMKLPDCYTVNHVPPLQKWIKGLQDTNLFYIFYNMPGEVMQVAAAHILYVRFLRSGLALARTLMRAHRYKRNWRYHKELQLWITRAPDPVPEPTPSGKQESGTYLVFDTTKWQPVRARAWVGLGACETSSSPLLFRLTGMPPDAAQVKREMLLQYDALEEERAMPTLA
jgi:CCR4-NOT transcription complex subunit 2